MDEDAIAALFERWNAALISGDPVAVVARYGERSVLLPTLSAVPRVAADEKLDYFRAFMARQPSAEVTWRMIHAGAETCVDAGLMRFRFASDGTEVVVRYTFVYARAGGDWRIIVHHSSFLPE
jgi:uncharacterized protein (TIGR02246 family)